jgi:hypothetical protein
VCEDEISYNSAMRLHFMRLREDAAVVPQLPSDIPGLKRRIVEEERHYQRHADSGPGITGIAMFAATRGVHIERL